MARSCWKRLGPGHWTVRLFAASCGSLRVYGWLGSRLGVCLVMGVPECDASVAFVGARDDRHAYGEGFGGRASRARIGQVRVGMSGPRLCRGASGS